MAKWWQWLRSPVKTWREWLAARRAKWEKALLDEQRRIEDQVKQVEAEAEQAAQQTLALIRARLEQEVPPGVQFRSGEGADRLGTPLLLTSHLGADSVYTQATTIYGSAGHLETTLAASVAGEEATLLNIQTVSVGRGIGSAALRFTEPLLAELGARVVRARLRPANPEHLARLLRFFEKNGYRLVPDAPEPVVEKRLT